MTDNPYTLLFGKEPAQLISRLAQSSDILDAFHRTRASQQVYLITGVRGSGKTVFMTEIANRLRKEEEWIVLELNPETDLMQGLASKLSSENSLLSLFQRANINLSLLGLGLEIAGAAPVSNYETAITKMLEAIRKKGKKVLITIDEVSNTKKMRIFASAYQIFVRQELPIFLLMTGLYENINALQNEKTLTFLYRAPRIELNPLNLDAIAQSYVNTLRIEKEEAQKMASITKGYSFAFQVLGYFAWEVGGNYHAILSDFRHYLEDYVYEKIWSECSKKDREIVTGIASVPSGKTSEILQKLGWDKSYFSIYRARLIRRGIIDGQVYGLLTFTLPYFSEFVNSKTDF